ncbi:MAG: enoyl-CoA hydratase/isomerase family protein [Gemmatimonadota bacterium]|nr:MAG: enoyl-CoA hydratase/isomerase family protein [Gemmatimonadota bacterium]
MYEESFSTIAVDVDESSGVATMSLNRPEKRNALSAELVDELSDALAWADADERVRVVLLRGEGKDFCAGVDLNALSEMMEAGVEDQLADADALGDLFLILRRIELPVVAAVRGHAVAGGCGLATACDIVLAADDARFGYPEVKIGFLPAMVIAMLRRAAGEKRAFELVVTGRTIDAEMAERYGLVQHVFPSDEFERGSREFAEDLARRSASAVSLSKRLIYQTERHSFEAAIRAGAEMNALARMTEDYREGVRSFLASKKKKGKRDR